MLQTVSFFRLWSVYNGDKLYNKILCLNDFGWTGDILRITQVDPDCRYHTALYQSTLYRKNCSSCNCIHQTTAWIRKPPNKIARNPPIRPKEGATLRAQDIKRMKLVRLIIPKTDAATIEIHPKIKIVVGYLDSVAHIISATPIMILITTAKTCRLKIPISCESDRIPFQD